MVEIGQNRKREQERERRPQHQRRREVFAVRFPRKLFSLRPSSLILNLLVCRLRVVRNASIGDRRRRCSKGDSKVSEVNGSRKPRGTRWQKELGGSRIWRFGGSRIWRFGGSRIWRFGGSRIWRFGVSRDRRRNIRYAVRTLGSICSRARVVLCLGLSPNRLNPPQRREP